MYRLREFAVAVALTILPFSLLGASAVSPSPAPARGSSAVQERADQFLDLVNSTYKALYTVNSEAQWKAVTDVTPEHDAAAETAAKAYAAFNGSAELINETRELLKHRTELQSVTVRELNQILLNAAEYPMTNPLLVGRRIQAETRLVSAMNSFQFKYKGKPITANQIDDLLTRSTDLNERKAVWEASKEIGAPLRDHLAVLQHLRNGVAGELNYPDYFSLEVASYGMTTGEMLKMNDQFMNDLRPLYLQLHTWVKYKLAEKYHQPVPNKIPAHWLNNRWAQNWTGIVESANIDPYFKGKTAEWIAKTAEDFYLGLGLKPLPPTFWVKSDLYPVPPGNPRKKNTHASCWHIDLENDIRSLQNIEPNSEWFYAAHHELGHGHYFESYTRPEVPPLLRIGPNPGFHEGIGELAALASSQVPYLKAKGILPADFKEDQTQFLLDDALSRSVPFIFFASGTMTHWEADVYAHHLDNDEWNERWWEYVSKYQGVEPPDNRTEPQADYASKTHINDTPAYYYNYAVATVLKFQLNDYIARQILHQPPQSCNYAGNKEVGTWLYNIMKKGDTEDWRKVLKDATGEDLSTRAMVEYFKPLMAWLEEQNKGRKIGWDEDQDDKVRQEHREKEEHAEHG
jgi:peptidyl-dipeptidase A